MRELNDLQRLKLVDLLVQAAHARAGVGIPPALPCPPPVWLRWLAGETVDHADLTLAIVIRLKSPLTLTRELVRMASLTADRGEMLRAAAAGQSLTWGVANRTFAPAIATDWDDLSEVQFAQLLNGGDYVVEPKHDGVRCLAHISNGSVMLETRERRPIAGHQALRDALGQAFSGAAGVIDGELLAEDGTWSSTISALSGHVSGCFHAFDWIPEHEIISRDYTMPAIERWNELHRRLPMCQGLVREIARDRPLLSVDQVERACDAAIDAGHEGLVLHHRLSPYRPGQSRAWIKVKRFRSAEFHVRKVNISKGRARSIRVDGWAYGRAVSADVSAGLSDIDRASIAANPGAWLNAEVEVRFQGVTRDGSLRFPSFMRNRSLERADSSAANLCANGANHATK